MEQYLPGLLLSAGILIVAGLVSLLYSMLNRDLYAVDRFEPVTFGFLLGAGTIFILTGLFWLISNVPWRAVCG